MRFRNVECKIFMEFSKTVATLPDKACFCRYFNMKFELGLFPGVSRSEAS